MRTRVGTTVDTQRLGASIARPGIDTRVWISLAFARGESMVDAANGVFVDVTCVPHGEQYTARVASNYAGTGFGAYAKIHANDALLVAAPEGDPGHGLVVLSRFWSSIDTPPQDSVDNPDDIVLTVEADKNVRIKLQGSGQVFLDTAGGNVHVATAGGNAVVDSGAGKVFLGADNLITPNDGVVHGTGIDSFTGATYFALQSASSVVHAKKI